jgi:hypothetical protein
MPSSAAGVVARATRSTIVVLEGQRGGPEPTVWLTIHGEPAPGQPIGVIVNLDGGHWQAATVEVRAGGAAGLLRGAPPGRTATTGRRPRSVSPAEPPAG